MSFIYSIHDLLDTPNWNIAEIEEFLERDATTINTKDRYDRTPLLVVLRNNRGSPINLVRLLIQYGANVNLKNNQGDTLLHTALRFYRNDEAMIRVLLEADVNKYAVGKFSDSFLCAALRWCATKDIVKLLLDKGFPLDTCRDHGYILHCAASYVLKEDVTDQLIEAGADVNKIDSSNKSPMCHALRTRSDINILLKAGGSLSACRQHASPFFCALDNSTGTIVTDDMLKRLLSVNANLRAVDIDGRTPLHLTLLSKKYEMKAIWRLIDLLEIDFEAVCNTDKNNLLHLTLMNEHYNLDVVKFLLKKGFQVDQVNILKQSALHLAANNPNCQLSLMNLLMKRCSNMNAMDQEGRTPLSYAMEKQNDFGILKSMLTAGARFGFTDDLEIPIITMTLKEFLEEDEALDSKLLLKYYILENPGFNIHKYTLNHSNFKKYTRYIADCQRELRIMESINIDQDHSLLEFLRTHSELPMNAAKFDPENYEVLNQLLRLVPEGAFRIYFDVIWTKFRRSSMKTKLEDLRLYTVKHYPESTCVQKKVVLSYDSACVITEILSNADLLKLILSFNNAVNHAQVSCCQNTFHLEGNRSPQRSGRYPLRSGRSPLRAARSPLRAARQPLRAARYPLRAARYPLRSARYPKRRRLNP